MTEMTIRAALTKKKMLDKQIKEMSRENFFAIVSKNETFIEGMTCKEWEERVQARFNSFNDKVKYRDALNVAILHANAINLIDVPKFNGLNSKPTKEMERISFAAAISRKGYYTELLQYVTRMISVRNEASSMFSTRVREAESTVRNRMNAEYGNTAVAVSSSERNKREEEMLKQLLPDFLDPNKLSTSLEDVKDFLENYIAEIDSILGHATEVTMVTVAD